MHDIYIYIYIYICIYIYIYENVQKWKNKFFREGFNLYIYMCVCVYTYGGIFTLITPESHPFWVTSQVCCSDFIMNYFNCFYCMNQEWINWNYINLNWKNCLDLHQFQPQQPISDINIYICVCVCVCVPYYFVTDFISCFWWSWSWVNTYTKKKDVGIGNVNPGIQNIY